MPRLKVALAYAVDYADEGPVQDDHMLRGLLSVPDSLAADVLAEHAVTLEKVEVIELTTRAARQIGIRPSSSTGGSGRPPGEGRFHTRPHRPNRLGSCSATMPAS
jgi:hypothetical protein